MRARTSLRYRSADSTHSSYEDAPPGALDSCRSTVATPTSRNFQIIEHSVESARLPRPIGSVQSKQRSRFRWFPQNRTVRQEACTLRSFARAAFVLHNTRINVHRSGVVLRQRRLPDSALSIPVLEMIRSDNTLITLRRSVKVLRLSNDLLRE